jgi:Uma2 family endonuclease
LRTRRGRRRGFYVFSDCLIDWGVRRLKPSSPDVSVFDRVRTEPDLTKGTFRLARYGGRCLLGVEIVSPDTRDNDVVRKLDEYYRARVPLYVIVDWKGPGHPRQLLGYRRRKGGYAPMRLDRQGRLRIPTLKVQLGLRDEWLVCYDEDTGEEIGTYEQLSEERDAARQERDAARQERDAARQERDAAQQERDAAEGRIRQLEEELRRRS